MQTDNGALSIDMWTETSAPAQDLSPPGESNYAFHSFHESSMTSEIILSAAVARFHVRYMYKTIARLERGNGFPSVDAISGWSHHDEQSAAISGKRWTDEVFAICRVVGHKMHSHNYEGARPGNWNACHSEKQLVTYFINRHVFLLNEIPTKHQIKDERRMYEERYLLRAWRGDIADEEYDRGWEDVNREEERTLRELFDARAPVSLREQRSGSAGRFVLTVKICQAGKGGYWTVVST
jgi:hypothetical protein